MKDTQGNIIPRRNDLNKNTSAELAIRDAIVEVEKLGADVRLTDIVVQLSETKEKLSDFIDSTL